MKILFLADVVGKSGRAALSKYVPLLKDKYDVDFTIVNGENSAHGKGITMRIYNAFKSIGVDCITLGNHAFSKHEILDHINQCNDLAYPNNHPLAPDQNGIRSYRINGVKLHVINILGRSFMSPEPTASPFEVMDDFLETIDSDDMIFVDFHGETTAEKRAFYECYKNRCIAVVGTHTHVQTADEMVDNGCAFISDAGMVGPFHSVLGREIQQCIIMMRENISLRYQVSEQPAIVCGVIINVDDTTHRALSIERIQIRPGDSL